MSQDFLKVPKKMLSQLNLNSITNILDGVLKYYAEENLMATKKSLDETVIRALVGETENLKKLGVMNVLQPEKLVRIINILMHHVNGSIASRNGEDITKKSCSKALLRMHASTCVCNILLFSKTSHKNNLESIIEILSDYLLPTLQLVILPDIKTKKRTNRNFNNENKFIEVFNGLITRISSLLLEKEPLQNILCRKVLDSLIKTSTFGDKQLEIPVFNLIASLYKTQISNRAYILHQISPVNTAFCIVKPYVQDYVEMRYSTRILFDISHKLTESDDMTNEKYIKIMKEIEDTAMAYINLIYEKSSHFENLIQEVLKISCDPIYPASKIILECCVKQLNDIVTIEGEENNRVIACLDTILKISSVLLNFVRKKDEIFENAVQCLNMQKSTAKTVKISCYKTVIEYLSARNKKNEMVLAVLLAMADVSDDQNFYKYTREILEENVELPGNLSLSTTELCRRYIFVKTAAKIFENLLEIIFSALTDQSTLIRSKAMRILAALISVDANLLQREDIVNELELALSDEKPLLRQNAVELLGKIDTKEHVDKFYTVLLLKLDDTSAGVKKAALKVLSKFCLAHSDAKITSEIVTGVMSKHSDDLTMQNVFLDAMVVLLWPTKKEEVEYKVNLMFDLISISDLHARNFQDIIDKIFILKKEDNELESYTQMLLEYLSQKTIQIGLNFADECKENLKYFSILEIFARTKPVQLEKFVGPFQNIVIGAVTNKINVRACTAYLEMLKYIFEACKNCEVLCETLVVEKLVTFVKTTQSEIVEPSMELLSIIINNRSRDFTAVQNILREYIEYLENAENSDLNKILRRIFVVGLTLKFFNFKEPNVCGELTVQTPEKVFKLLLELLKKFSNNTSIMLVIIKSIRFVCYQNMYFWLNSQLKHILNELLHNGDDSIKRTILWGFEEFLKVESSDSDIDWLKEDLRILDNQSSDRAEHFAQSYRNTVFNCCYSNNPHVRIVCTKILRHLVVQGLTQPMHVVHHLVALSTDNVEFTVKVSEKLLNEISRTSRDSITWCVKKAMEKSYKMQKLMQTEAPVGFNKDTYKAINSHLYALTSKTRRDKRSFVLHIFKNFQEQKIVVTYDYLCYLMENLATFPYAILDDILFVMYQIDTVILVRLTQIMQQASEILSYEPNSCTESKINGLNDTSKAKLSKLMNISDGCITLYKIKKYLGKAYSVSEKLLDEYNTYTPIKGYEKPIKKNDKVVYNVKRFNNDSLLNRFERLKSFLVKLTVDREWDHDESLNKFLEDTKACPNEAPAEKMEVDEEIYWEKPKPSTSKRKSGNIRKKTPKKRKFYEEYSDSSDDSDYTP